jgi:hypothetical protein
MCRPDFFDALFELADMWWVAGRQLHRSQTYHAASKEVMPCRLAVRDLARCETVSAEDYAELLRGLLTDTKNLEKAQKEFTK